MPGIFENITKSSVAVAGDGHAPEPCPSRAQQLTAFSNGWYFENFNQVPSSIFYLPIGMGLTVG
jgi:hypothetical protein